LLKGAQVTLVQNMGWADDGSKRMNEGHGEANKKAMGNTKKRDKANFKRFERPRPESGTSHGGRN
jgi:hypothetical protein